MSNDLPNSEVVDQFHNDLLVERFADNHGTGFSNDLEKGSASTRCRKRPLGGFFYSLVTPQKEG